MRLILAITILLHSCTTTESKKNADTKKQSVKEINSNQLTRNDSILIPYQYDTMLIAKEDSAGIVNTYPAFTGNPVIHPDSLYETIGPVVKFKTVSGVKKELQLHSELGHDYFNMFYAYFLRNKNNFPGADSLRKQLIDAAHTMRGIFLSIEGFGTYYTNQHWRIYGYTEFWLLNYKKLINKNIELEKRQFISSLKFYIKDAVAKNNDIAGEEEKLSKEKELLAEADRLVELLKDDYVFTCIKNYRKTNYPTIYSYH